MEVLIVFVLVMILAVGLFILLRRLRKRIPDVDIDGKPGKIDIPREKSRGVAYALWAVTGLFGGHRYYLGYYWTAPLYDLASLFVLLNLMDYGPGISIPEYVFVIGGLTIAAWVVDFLLLSWLARKSNRKMWERWFRRQSDRWTEVRGTVRDFSTRQLTPHRDSQIKVPKQVMNFRLEETDDRGDVIKLLDVELMGNWITGNLRNGDKVIILGKLSKENILRALSAQNETTGAIVKIEF